MSFAFKCCSQLDRPFVVLLHLAAPPPAVNAFRLLARAHAIAHVPSPFAEVCAEYGFSPEAVLKEFSACQLSFPPLSALREFESSVKQAGSTGPSRRG